jgi:hypothetical protein
MNKYIIEYQGEVDDNIFTKEIEIEANDSVEAIKKFFDKKINYRQIKNIKQQLNK